MAISPLLRPLGIAAGIVGACQGLTWTVLSLLSILIAADAWEPEYTATQIFEITVIQIFFYPDSLPIGAGDDLIMTGDVFLGFSCFYFVFSFMWMVTSLTMLWVLLREKWSFAPNTIKGWSALTGIISLFDFIIVIMLGVDYNHLSKTFPGASSFVFEVVVGSVMTIVARGYVLWVANVICTIFFFKWASELTDVDTGKDRDRRPYINGFDDPWQTSEQPRFPRSLDNQGYQPDDRNFGRSISQDQPRRFIPSEQQMQPQMQQQQIQPQRPPKPRAPQVPQQHQHHQQMPQGPYIPQPDYPNYPQNDLERMPRSALKTKSYYN